MIQELQDFLTEKCFLLWCGSKDTLWNASSKRNILSSKIFWKKQNHNVEEKPWLTVLRISGLGQKTRHTDKRKFKKWLFRKWLLNTEQQCVSMVYLIWIHNPHVCHLSLLHILPSIPGPKGQYFIFFKKGNSKNYGGFLTVSVLWNSLSALIPEPTVHLIKHQAW